MELATLGGGCFWCLEAVYQRIAGVVSVMPGYAGGAAPHPTYEEVCSGETGHAEVVQIAFDPEQIAYREILDIFWQTHDPTTLNRQGGDVGTQYRSIILYHSDAQKSAAVESLQRCQERTAERIVTEIVPLTVFHPAEEYHRNYFDLHKRQPYCMMVISPKLRKLGLSNPS